MEQLRLLFALAFRSLGAHRTKSFIVGALLFFGAFLVVLGSALLDSVERSMQRSVTASLAGHIQLYSKKARDPLALFGGAQPGADDIGQIENFASLKSAVAAHPNVKAIVPMGIDLAFISGGNDLDRMLEAFRIAVKEKDAAAIAAKKGQIAEIARLLQSEWAFGAQFASSKVKMEQKLEDLARIQSEAFWADFDTDPEGKLTFLDTHLAPMIQDGRNIPLRYLGTDLEAFQANFDRFEIVDGQMVPAGKRGFLFNKKFYEENVKHKVAVDLDKIHDALTNQGKTIADDPLLTNRAGQLARLYRTITLQLDVEKAQKLDALLQKELPEVKGDLTARVKAFLLLNDDNFARRYAFFYENIAPMIELYDVRVGDILTVRTLTKRGQLKAVNVKVYGTFRFKGLDKSDVAGTHNLMDLMTFRDLYDLMTEARKKELEAMRQKTIEAPTSANADDLFFGEGQKEFTVESGQNFDEFAGADLSSEKERLAALLDQTYSAAAIEDGVVLNAAVVLKDPATLTQDLITIGQLAEPLSVQAVDWKTAAGMVGQFVGLVRLFLVVALRIIFFVALVIINNSMITATMERIGEIGTLRAIGAQRGFVLAMFVVETLVLGLVAGGAGALVASLIVTVFGQIGIPANDIGPLIFLFAGSHLYPNIAVGHLVAGVFVIILVSLVSALYPAMIASRVQPVVAMQVKE